MRLDVSVELGRLKRFLWTSIDNYVYLKHVGPLEKRPQSAPELNFFRIHEEDQLPRDTDKCKLIYLINRGCTVYLARSDGVAAGRYVLCSLSRFRPYGYNGHKIFGGNESYYIFYCRTYEPFRGKGIFPQMLRSICEDVYKENPCGVVYTSAEAKNRPSQRGIEKAGFHLAGRLRYMAAMNRPMISLMATESDIFI